MSDSENHWCRVCLSTNVRMYCVEKTKLKDIYEDVTKTKLDEEGRPRTVCFVCHSQLQRCGKLAASARRSEDQLRTILQHGIAVTYRTIEKLDLGKQNQYLSTVSLGHMTVEVPYNKHKSTKKKHAEKELVFKEVSASVEDTGNSICQITKDELTDNSITDCEDNDVSDIFNEGTLSLKEEQAKEELIEMGHSTISESVNATVLKLEHEQKVMYDIEEKPVVTNRFEDLISFEEDKDTLVDGMKPENIQECREESKEDLLDIEEHSVTEDIGSPSTLIAEDIDIVNDTMNNSMKENAVIDMSDVKGIANSKAITPKNERSDESEIVLSITPKQVVHQVHQVESTKKRNKTKEKSLLKENMSTNLYLCDICDKNYYTKHGLANHLKVHSKQNRKNTFECTICNKKMSRKHNLTMHMKSHKTHIKPQIDKKLRRNKLNTDVVENELKKNEERTDDSEKRFECDKCRETFTSKNDIITHVQSHTPERVKPFENPLINNRDSEKAKQESHRTQNEKVYTCDDCDQTFSSRNDIVKHIKNHTSTQTRKRATPDARETYTEPTRSDAPQTFTCTCCLPVKTYNKHWAFVRHINRYPTSIQAHQCKVCRHNITFDTLINHMTFKDGIPNPYYLCEECKAYRDERKAKAQTSTTDKILCNVCDESFSTEGNLNRHKKVHENENKYPCIKCDELFTTRTKLRGHVDTVHIRPKKYVCKECKQRFAYEGHLKIHMNVHTGKNLYKCTKCDKTFAQKGSFTSHMRSHTRFIRLKITRPRPPSNKE